MAKLVVAVIHNIYYWTPTLKIKPTMERINYGAEYKANTDNNSYGYGRHDADIPCAVCHVSDRTAVYMVPTKYSYMPDSREYTHFKGLA